MKISKELRNWFLETNKEHILSGVRNFKANNWYEGDVQSAMDFYKDKQDFFAHAIEQQKNGTSHVSDWFETFNCNIDRNIEEMMHLMAQIRDGDISYKMLFEEPKHPKKNIKV